MSKKGESRDRHGSTSKNVMVILYYPQTQKVTEMDNSDHICVSQAPDVLDPTAEVIPAPGVNGENYKSDIAAKVISAPEVQGKSLIGG